MIRKLALNICILSLVLFFAAEASFAEKPKIGSKDITVVALGSSTTAPRNTPQGPLVVYADLLRKELPKLGINGPVVNAGVPADTTALALKRFGQDVLRHGPSLVIIQLGINDSAYDVWKNPPAEKPRVSLDVYEKNLRYMVKKLKNQDAAVILMTPNSVAWTEKLKGLYGKPPYDPEDEDGFNVSLKKYVAAMKRIGEEEDVPVVDSFEAFRSQKDCTVSDLLLDGLHPNDRGHRLEADLLLKQIEKMKDQFKPSVYGERIHQKAKELPHKLLGPFVKLKDGSIMAADEQCVQISRDGGKTWTSTPIFPEGTKFATFRERAIVQTEKGTIVILFMNAGERCFKWDNKKGGPLPDCQLPVYVVRSVDGGKTWLAPQKLQDGWCGYCKGMIQTKSGRIVAAVERAIVTPGNAGKHIMYSYVSDDEGETWKRSEAIDIGPKGGYGDHGGTMEGTLVELKDGRVYQLLRTTTGRFWETYSEDGGLTWQEPKPSKIEANSSPGMLQRLESGRIVLLWNKYRDQARRFGRRDTLYMAFSDDECQSWSQAVPVATNIVPPGEAQHLYRQSYPSIFEYKPGELWITTMQGMVRMELREKDFVN